MTTPIYKTTEATIYFDTNPSNNYLLNQKTGFTYSFEYANSPSGKKLLFNLNIPNLYLGDEPIEYRIRISRSLLANYASYVDLTNSNGVINYNILKQYRDNGFKYVVDKGQGTHQLLIQNQNNANETLDTMAKYIYYVDVDGSYDNDVAGTSQITYGINSYSTLMLPIQFEGVRLRGTTGSNRWTDEVQQTYFYTMKYVGFMYDNTKITFTSNQSGIPVSVALGVNGESNEMTVFQSNERYNLEYAGISVATRLLLIKGLILIAKMKDGTYTHYDVNDLTKFTIENGYFISKSPYKLSNIQSTNVVELYICPNFDTLWGTTPSNANAYYAAYADNLAFWSSGVFFEDNVSYTYLPRFNVSSGTPNHSYILPVININGLSRFSADEFPSQEITMYARDAVGTYHKVYVGGPQDWTTGNVGQSYLKIPIVGTLSHPDDINASLADDYGTQTSSNTYSLVGTTFHLYSPYTFLWTVAPVCNGLRTPEPTFEINTDLTTLTFKSYEYSYIRAEFGYNGKNLVLEGYPTDLKFVQVLNTPEDVIQHSSYLESTLGFNMRSFEDLSWTLTYGYDVLNQTIVRGTSLKNFPGGIFAEYFINLHGVNPNVLSYVPNKPILVHNTLAFSGTEITFQIQMNGIHDLLSINYYDGTSYNSKIYKRSYSVYDAYSYVYDVSFSTTETQFKYIEQHSLTGQSVYNSKPSDELVIVKSNTYIETIDGITDLSQSYPYEYVGTITKTEDTTFSGEYPTTGFDVYLGISTEEITVTADISAFLVDKKLSQGQQFHRYFDLTRSTLEFSMTELDLSGAEFLDYFVQGTLKNGRSIYGPKEDQYYYMTALPSGSVYSTNVQYFATGQPYGQVVPDPSYICVYNDDSNTIVLNVSFGFFERYPATNYSLAPLKLSAVLSSGTETVQFITDLEMTETSVRNGYVSTPYVYNDTSAVDISLAVTYLDVYNSQDIIVSDVSINPVLNPPTNIQVRHTLDGGERIVLSFDHNGVSTSYSIRGYTRETDTTYFTSISDIDYLHEGIGEGGNVSHNITGVEFTDASLNFPEPEYTSIANLVGLGDIYVDISVNYYDRSVNGTSALPLKFNYDITMSNAVPEVSFSTNKITNIVASISSEEIHTDFTNGTADYLLRMYQSGIGTLNVAALRAGTGVDVSQVFTYTNSSSDISLNGNLVHFTLDLDDLSPLLQEASPYLYFFVDISLDGRILDYIETKSPAVSLNLAGDYDTWFVVPSFSQSYDSDTYTLTISSMVYGSCPQNVRDISLTLVEKNYRNSGMDNTRTVNLDTRDTFVFNNVNDVSLIDISLEYDVNYLEFITPRETSTTNFQINPQPNSLNAFQLTNDTTSNTIHLHLEYVGSVSRFDISVVDTEDIYFNFMETVSFGDVYYDETSPYIYDYSFMMSSIGESGDRFVATVTTYGIGSSPITITSDTSLVFVVSPTVERIYPFIPGYFAVDISLEDVSVGSSAFVYYRETGTTDPYQLLNSQPIDISLSHTSSIENVSNFVIDTSDDEHQNSNLTVYPSLDDTGNRINGRGMLVVQDSLSQFKFYDIVVRIKNNNIITNYSNTSEIPDERYSSMFNDLTLDVSYTQNLGDGSLNVIDVSFTFANDYIDSVIIWFDENGNYPDFTNTSRTSTFMWSELEESYLNSKTYTTGISFEQDIFGNSTIIDVSDLNFAQSYPYISPFTMDLSSSLGVSNVYLTDISFYEKVYNIQKRIEDFVDVASIYYNEGIDLSNISYSIRATFVNDISSYPLGYNVMTTPFIPYPVEIENIHIRNLELEGDNSLNINIYYEDYVSASNENVRTIPITGISLEVIDLSDANSVVATATFNLVDLSLGGYYSTPRIPLLSTNIDLTGHTGDGSTIASLHDFRVLVQPFFNNRNATITSRDYHMETFDINAITVYIPTDPSVNYPEIFTISFDVEDATYVETVRLYRYEGEHTFESDELDLSADFGFYGINDPSNNPYLEFTVRENGENVVQMNTIGEISANTFYVVDVSTIVISTYNPDRPLSANYYYSWFMEVIYAHTDRAIGVDLSSSLIPYIQATATQTILSNYEFTQIGFNDIKNEITIKFRDGFVREGDDVLNDTMNFLLLMFSINGGVLYDEYSLDALFEHTNLQDPTTGLPLTIDIAEDSTEVSLVLGSTYKDWTISVPFEQTYHSLISLVRSYRNMVYKLKPEQQLYPLYTPISVSRMGQQGESGSKEEGINILFYFELPPPEASGAVEKYIIYRWIRETAVTNSTVDSEYSYENIVAGNTEAYIWKEIAGSLDGIQTTEEIDPNMKQINNRNNQLYETRTRRLYLQDFTNSEIFSEKMVIYRIAVVYRDLPSRPRGVLGGTDTFTRNLPINFAQFHAETYVQYAIPKLCLCPPQPRHPQIINNSNIFRQTPRRLWNAMRLRHKHR